MRIAKVLYIDDNIADLKAFQLMNDPPIKFDIDYIDNANDLMRDTIKDYDFIFLDLHMPGLGGLDFLKMLKENPETNHIPVVIVSASEMPQNVVEASELGASAYILKPVQLDHLIRVFSKSPRFALTLVVRGNENGQ